MSGIDRRAFITLAGAGLLAGTAPAHADASASYAIPQSIVDRYGLDTRWYGKYIDAWGFTVLGPRTISNSAMKKARRQLGTLLWTYPYWPVPEMDRRDVRLVLVARGEPHGQHEQRERVRPRVRAHAAPDGAATHPTRPSPPNSPPHGTTRAPTTSGPTRTRPATPSSTTPRASKGPAGGDGVHNKINTRRELATYDRPLFNLFERVYLGAELSD